MLNSFTVDPSIAVNDAEGSRVNLRKLLICYLFAIFLILGGVFGSMIATQFETAGLAKSATAININGRQRMLTQRIAYLSQSLSYLAEHDDAVSDATRSVTQAKLVKAIDQFESAHERLLSDNLLSAQSSGLYFTTSAGPSLDVRVRSYISAARAVAAQPGTPGGMQRLQSQERAGLLQALDRVVTALEVEAIDRANWLKNIEAYSLILAVIVVVLEVVYIFIPGHRLIERTLHEMEDRNRHLLAAQTALASSLGDLEADLAANRSGGPILA